jgi:hypothetical protein
MKPLLKNHVGPFYQLNVGVQDQKVSKEIDYYRLITEWMV